MGISTAVAAAENSPWVHVELQGLSGKLEKNVRASLSLLQPTAATDVVQLPIETLHQRAPREIELALQPFGYYQSDIEATLHQRAPNHWIAHYKIQLKPPIRIGHHHFQLTGPGQSNLALQSLLKDFAPQPGKRLQHAVYEKSKNTLLSAAIHQGYLQARFTQHKIEIDLEQQQANITLTLDTGPLHYFGPVSFANTVLAPSLLQRYPPFKPGERYDPKKILDFEHALAHSNFFSEINVQPQLEAVEQHIPVKVTVKELKANNYLTGIGFDTNTGLRLRLGWEQRRLNQWGHQLKSNFKLSSKDLLTQANYLIPGKQPITDQYRISTVYANEKYHDNLSKRFKLGASESRTLTHFERTLGLSFLAESFKEEQASHWDSSKFILPSIQLRRLKSDHLSDPHQGYRLQLTLRGAMDLLFHTRHFAQVDLEYRWLKPISKAGSLLLRSELGATFPRDIQNLPLSLRFFAGGDQSLRGFKYRSLPKNHDQPGVSHVAGGAYLLLGSIEYEHQIKGPFSLATFIDGGNALNHWQEPLQASLGLGVRWHTPIGPLRVDIAYPITQSHLGWRVHINFGPQL